MNAYMGKILWVDLSKGTCSEEDIPVQVYENYLSGMGLAAYILFHRMHAGVDPLGPENILGFVSGLLTGTGSLMTGRWMAVAKSPLTGTWGDANCGGNLAPAIKQCGYDGIFFTGISPTPVYLFVDHGHCELRDATQLWGKDTRETEDAIKSSVEGREACVACIGVAGEKKSLIAGIVNDQGRLAARSGLGAVMGSKRLKAIALNGSYRVAVYDPGRMKYLSERFNRWATSKPPFFNGSLFAWVGKIMRWMPLQMKQDGMLYKILLSKWGTSSMNQVSVEIGDAPIRNWKGTDTDYHSGLSRNINPDLIAKREKGKYHCYSCPVGCGGYCYVNGNGNGNEITHKPEYETILALGGLLLINDLDSLFTANEKLNRAGMDSISAGGTIAFAFECYEKGLITEKDTGGINLTWGNSQSMLELLDKMISREGIGDLLADGSKRAAFRIGNNAADAAVQSGGQELAMHDGRNDPGYALLYAVSPTPGRHTIGSYLYYEMYQLWTKVKGAPRVKPILYSKNTKYTTDAEKAQWAACCSQFNQVMNGTGMCMFGGLIGVNRLPLFEWLNTATGWNKSPDEYMRIGWNIENLRQAFNAREDIPLRHEINARAIGHPPLTSGANKNRSIDLAPLVKNYWMVMGWDAEKGTPDMDIIMDQFNSIAQSSSR